ncbi:MAG: hypothetical protein ACFB0B_11500 [Thermonemataceae bacterium]
MIIICKNCGNQFEGNFCNQCGQKAATKPFRFKDVLLDVTHNVLDVDKGFLHNARDLTLHPAPTIDAYLAGKRVVYYGWFKYLFLTISIATVITFYSNSLQEVIGGFSEGYQKEEAATSQAQQKLNELLFSYFNLFYLAYLPFLSVFSYWFFRKYSLMEHVVASALIIAQSNIFYILLFTPLLFLENLPFYESLYLGIYLFSLTIFLVYQVVVQVQLFKRTSYLKTTLKGLLVFILSYLFYVLAISILVAIISAVYLDGVAYIDITFTD